ncbi:uncharacterized protein LOC106646052 [Copidosoma floridanum]|uniref:uncharacterized protein LOC106646052 n=1 Tax=Copidosoma floridanum TaxID=29053 RepID=UPI0006C9A892|nr:uncharacterized protein LOC106646052 [Copidosoma floridanum]
MKLLILTFALYIGFVLSQEYNKESQRHKRNYITSRQNFCYNETGFDKEKHTQIRLTRAYPLDISYFCFVGCATTQPKGLFLSTRSMNTTFLLEALTRTFTVEEANNIIDKCKDINTNGLCATGRSIHECFAKQGFMIADWIGYLDGDIV